MTQEKLYALYFQGEITIETICDTCLYPLWMHFDAVCPALSNRFRTKNTEGDTFEYTPVLEVIEVK
jgi:hypothetical protein